MKEKTVFPQTTEESTPIGSTIRRRQVLSPFGDVIPEPRCPYCGQSISFWAVHALSHTRFCARNPEVIKKLEQVIEGLEIP